VTKFHYFGISTIFIAQCYAEGGYATINCLTIRPSVCL